MLSELMCQESINTFISLIILGPCTWSSIIPPIFFTPLKTKKKVCNKNGFSTGSDPFFFFLLTAGKMLGVPRKERNRLRRVERREGSLRTQWSGRGKADWTPVQLVFLLKISKAQRSNYRHFQPLVTQHSTEGLGQDGNCECVSVERGVCVSLPGPKHILLA